MKERNMQLKIKFINGKTRIVIAETKDQAKNFLTRLNQAFEHNHIILEMPKKIEIIPISSIERIQVSPPPVSDLRGAIKVTEEIIHESEF